MYLGQRQGRSDDEFARTSLMRVFSLVTKIPVTSVSGDFLLFCSSAYLAHPYTMQWTELI